ncbi:MAG: hypothetical protein WC472_03695 [Candidatus Paceibacterota bacterium]
MEQKTGMSRQKAGEIAFDFLKEFIKENGFILSSGGIEQEVYKYYDVLMGPKAKEQIRIFFWILYGQAIKDKFPEVEIIKNSSIHKKTLSEDEIKEISYLVFLKKMSEEKIILRLIEQQLRKILIEAKYPSICLSQFLKYAMSDMYEKACLRT